MHIREEPCSEKLRIRKYKFSCDECDTSIPEPLPGSVGMPNHFTGIFGKSGSGKSSLIYNFFKRGKMYYQKYDAVYVLSPSLATVEDSPFSTLPEGQVFSTISEEILESITNEIADSGDRVCIIIDDLVNELSKDTPLVRKLCHMTMNRRHLSGPGGGVSFFVTGQVYNKLALCLRKTLSHIFLFSTKNKRELMSIYDEHIQLPLKEFQDVLRHCFKRPHDFLYINLATDYTKCFHHNFNLLVLSDAPAEESVIPVPSVENSQ